MENHSEILKQYVSEQIALEEHLCSIIEEQISEIGEEDFADAKELLINARQVLERHFLPLTELLNDLERDALIAKTKSVSGNGAGQKLPPGLEQKNRRISRILRDNYSALNQITIGNTLLHTTALAFGSLEIASMALKHLKNLAPLVVRIGELVPDVLTRELHAVSPTVDLSVAQTALKNTKLAWQKES